MGQYSSAWLQRSVHRRLQSAFPFITFHYRKPTLLSIIVISRNQIKTIDICLDNILAATKASGIDRHGYEIVFVDSRSTDGTPERVRRRQDDRIRIVHVTGHTNAAIARNAGAAVARGDVFFFIDGDMEIGADFLRQAFDAEGKPIAPVIMGQLPEKFYDTNWKLLSEGPDRYKADHDHYRTEMGGSAIIRRDVFEEVGGYRPELRVNEDIDIGLRLSEAGYKTRILPVVMAVHHTIEYFDWSRQGRMLWDGSMCFPGAVWRRHWKYAGYWPILISHQRPTVVLLLSLLLSVFVSPWWLLLYLGYIVAKNLRRPGISLLQDLAGTTARSVGFLFGMVFFYPKHIPADRISFREEPPSAATPKPKQVQAESTPPAKPRAA
ncbi:MAG: glycosyltransferase [Lautropia sp.]|nr:glycosyltransferase [Lautropia sp.]